MQRASSYCRFTARATCEQPAARKLAALCLGLFLLFQQFVQAATVSIPTATQHSEALSISVAATNLTLQFVLEQGTGPLLVTLCRTGDAACHNLRVTDPSQSYELIVDEGGNPPINPGSYTLRIVNEGPDTADVQIQTTVLEHPFGPVPRTWENRWPLSIPELGTAASIIHVPQSGSLLSVEAGLRVAHPRIADLKLHLISPQGTRALMAANRGGASTEGMGRDNLFTNTVPVSAEGGPSVYTNEINTGLLTGYVHIDWAFYSLPDRMVVYQGDKILMDTGDVSWGGSTNLAFGPGNTTLITLVMNPGDNPEPDTAWDYTVTYSRAEYVYAVFTQDISKTLTPIASAPPPFTNATYIGSDPGYAEGIFYLPEGDLNLMAGEDIAGAWQLEIEDTQAGGNTSAPVLLGWELRLISENSAYGPALLTPGVAITNTVAPGKMLHYQVNPPAWVAAMTNRLSGADGNLRLWHNPSQPPSGTNQGDTLLLSGVRAGTNVLTTDGVPALVPGSDYFLGIQNTNSEPVTFSLQTDLSVPMLTNNAAVASVLGAASVAYFSYDVLPEETVVKFELSGLSTNVDLVVGPEPFPTLSAYACGSFNPGTNDEEVIVTRNSEPNPLQTGRWYVGIIGPPDSAYTLKATGYTNALPQIVTLYNAMPVAGTNNPAEEGTNGYYRFVVSTNSLRLEFEVTGASSDVALVVRKGWPPPRLLSHDYASNNSGTNDEHILVLDSSSPVPLNAGEWYITVINMSQAELSYTIQAREWSARGTSILVFPPVVEDGSVSLTWTSLPGRTYTLEGLTDLAETNWTAISPPVEASDYTTTEYLGAPTPYQFFRVRKD